MPASIIRRTVRGTNRTTTMHIPGTLPDLPPPPPNFAKSPLELVSSTGVKIVVSQVLPVLSISIVTPIGTIPLYFNSPKPSGFSSYGEF